MEEVIIQYKVTNQFHAGDKLFVLAITSSLV